MSLGNPASLVLFFTELFNLSWGVVDSQLGNNVVTSSISVFAQLKSFPFLKCISEVAPMVYVQPSV